MTKKHIRNNISILRSIRDRHVGKVSASIQTKINTIVDLYEERRISQFGTASVSSKTSPLKTTNKKQKASKKQTKQSPSMKVLHQSLKNWQRMQKKHEKLKK